MDDKMEARLGDEVIVAGYEALPDVYEWLIPDAKLTPEGSVAALGDLVQSLSSNARVLDCSSGTGQLAVDTLSEIGSIFASPRGSSRRLEGEQAIEEGATAS